MYNCLNSEVLSSDMQNRSKHKMKTHFAKIIVGGTTQNPYYEIMYYDLSDHTYHIGYGSYCLDYVVRWLEDEFDIVKQTTENAQIKCLADIQAGYAVELYDSSRWLVEDTNNGLQLFGPGRINLMQCYDEKFNFKSEGYVFPISKEEARNRNIRMIWGLPNTSSHINYETYKDTENLFSRMFYQSRCLLFSRATDLTIEEIEEILGYEVNIVDSH